MTAAACLYKREFNLCLNYTYKPFAMIILSLLALMSRSKQNFRLLSMFTMKAVSVAVDIGYAFINDCDIDTVSGGCYSTKWKGIF